MVTNNRGEESEIKSDTKCAGKTSLVVPWLTSPSNAGGAGSIPGRGAKISHALRPKHKTEAIL